MELNLNLLLHNITTVVTVIIIMGVGVSAYFNGPRQVANVCLLLACISASIFAISHAIGVNLSDPIASRSVLMFNLSIFYIGIFYLHAVLAFLGKDKKKEKILIFLYIIAVFMTSVFILLPNLFLLPSVPKMYFPNYYVPGVLNWVRIFYLYLICVVYAIYELVLSYRAADNAIEKKQYSYLLIATVGAFGIGLVPNFLVYDIQVDPIWGMFFGVVFGIPFVLAAVRYEIFNIKVIATQAFWYGLAIAIIGGLVTLINYSNDLVRILIPGFPLWVSSLISAVLAVTAAFAVWRRLRENDILKYEFINIMLHKFRTPMTYIRFSVDELRANPSPETAKTAVDRIDMAAKRLVELTDSLTEVSKDDKTEYAYVMETADLNQLVTEVISTHKNDAEARLLTINLDLSRDLKKINADIRRLRSVMHIIFDNAVMYSKQGGIVRISTQNRKGMVVCSIQDDGIGISHSDISLIFNRFFRTANAQSMDTEGMGMGLYLAKKIISSHRGKIWAESAGKGKGSIFSFSIPAVH